MALLALKAPFITTEGFFSKADVETIKPQLVAMKAKHGAIVEKVAKMTLVPADIIYSMMYVESKGDETAGVTGGGAMGIMQVSPPTAYEVMLMEYRQGRLTSAEEAMIKQYLPKITFANKKITQSYESLKSDITAALKNTPFNILMGAMYTGILIDKNADAGKMRLDKVIAQYNMGLYAKSTKTLDWKTKSETELYKKLNPITKAYILKIGGVNGVLSII